MGAATKVHKFSGGRLIVAPSDLSSPETNCGGTQMGSVQNTMVRITEKRDPLTDESRGSATVDATVLDDEIFITVTGTGWDENFIATVLYGASTGSGTPQLVYPQNVGGLAASRAVTLLWLPNDDLNDPAWIAYAAIPWSLPKPIYFSGRKPAVVTATFLAAPDASGRTWASNLLASLNGAF